MVGRGHDHGSAGVQLLGGVPAVEEDAHAPTAGGVEERLLRRLERQHAREVVVEQAGMLLVDDQEEVRMKRQWCAGAGLFSLRNDDRVGIRGVQPLTDLTPQRGSQLLAPLHVAIVLDQRERHVDPEPGDSTLKPERHDVLERLDVPPRSGGVDGVPPRFTFSHVRPAEVQGGLLVEEVLEIPTLPWSRRRHPGGSARNIERPFPHGQLLAPHVPVALGVGPVRVQLTFEPRVVDRGVTGDEVE